ncbi:MAG: class I SAM-dependent methyltransferase [Verrucomicrobia bacterium]|nr:class I SAM-dependent methyltransferase [Verrucomicrobiota bacterium]
MTFFQSIRAWFRRKILRDRAERWNHQYAIGRWEVLKAPAEYARFDACIALLRRHAAGGRLLEIGCGEALLQRRLAPGDYQRLVGVDISAVAIGRAQAFADHRVRYLVADMQKLELDETFDAVIFTESINYVPRRHQLLRNYARFLNEGGVFIVSIYRNKRSAGIWTEIHSVAAPIDRATTTNEVGAWDCEVLRLR